MLSRAAWGETSLEAAQWAIKKFKTWQQSATHVVSLEHVEEFSEFLQLLDEVRDLGFVVDVVEAFCAEGFEPFGGHVGIWGGDVGAVGLGWGWHEVGYNQQEGDDAWEKNRSKSWVLKLPINGLKAQLRRSWVLLRFRFAITSKRRLVIGRHRATSLVGSIRLQQPSLDFYCRSLELQAPISIRRFVAYLEWRCRSRGDSSSRGLRFATLSSRRVWGLPLTSNLVS